MRPSRKRPSGLSASPASGETRTMHWTRLSSIRDTESEPLWESRKEISAVASSSFANVAAACMYSSGEPDGTENCEASWVSASASAVRKIARETAEALRMSGAVVRQSGGVVVREAGKVLIASVLQIELPFGL